MTFITRFSPSYAKTLLYMLQSSDYNTSQYSKWFHRTNDFSGVMKRKKLVWTKKIKLLAFSELLIAAIVIIISWTLASIWIPLGLLPLMALPWLLAYGLVIPLVLGKMFIQNPKQKRIINDATAALASHKATKIAIVGSYGKTTMKEMLAEVLGYRLRVASTPGNLNTPLGTSQFIRSLNGSEEVLIFEMGESHVGDIKELCEIVKPDIGIVTGINQAHLESFGSIENTISTIFEIEAFVDGGNLYVNADDTLSYKRANKDAVFFSASKAGEWEVVDVSTSLEGSVITLRKDGKMVWCRTKLIGEHLAGVHAAVVEIADSLGLSTSEISDGMKRVKPVPHRMQPRYLHGALIIDDTYNGNIKGVESGLRLLGESDAKRRVYVTPGLVEQGSDTQKVHEKIGEMIAESADVVVLMQNSVTDYISDGMQRKKFGGKVLIVDDPLSFYQNLDHFVAKGDVILMQNDWTDNYA